MGLGEMLPSVPVDFLKKSWGYFFDSFLHACITSLSLSPHINNFTFVTSLLLPLSLRQLNHRGLGRDHPHCLLFSPSSTLSSTPTPTPDRATTTLPTTMCTTYQEFSDKLDRLDAEFGKKMEEQNKKFFADKPDESTLSPEMKEHYDKFEKMIKEHTDKFNKKMRDHSAHFKQKFQELLEQQKNAQFPGK